MVDLESLAEVIGENPPSTYIPGQYNAAGGSLFSGLLGNISPWLSLLAPSIDPHVSRLFGGNVLSPYGSMNSPTRYANQLMNQMDRQIMYGTMDQYHKQSRQNETAFLTQMYTGMNFDAKTAASMANNSFAPGNWLAGAAYRMGMQPMAMARGFRQAAYSAGIFSQGPMANLPNFLTENEMRLAYGGTTAPSTTALNNKFSNLFKTVSSEYASNPGQYGGLRGGEVGTVVAEMARTGGGKFRGGDVGTLSASIKDMSQAMGTMKELFQGDLPQLMDKLNSIFGVSAMGTFGGKQIQAKLLQMKHTARITGVSMEAMAEMSGVSRQYSMSVGGTGWGGESVARTMANMFGTGASMSYINEEEFRNRQLRNTTGAQQSNLSRLASGAYVLWASRQAGGANSADNQARFQLMMQGQDLSLGSLSKMTGFSVNDINMASRGMEAKKIMSETELGTGMAMDQRLRQIGKAQGDTLRKQLRGFGVTLSDDVLRTGTMDEIRSALAKGGLGGARLETAMGYVTSVKDFVAKQYSYGSAQELDAGMTHMRDWRKVAAAAKSRAALETELTDKLGINFGLTGVLSSIAKGETKVGELFTAATGLTLTKKVAGVLFQKMGDVTKKYGSTAEGADYISNMQEWILNNTMSGGKGMTEDDKAAFTKAVQGGDYGALEQMFEKNTVVGKRKALLGNAYFSGGLSINEKVKNAIERKVMGNDPNFNAEKTDDYEFINKIKGDDKKEKEYAKLKEEYGVSDTGMSMNELFSKLIAAVDSLINTIKGGDGK